MEVTAVWGDRDGDHDSGKRPGLARRVLTPAKAATGDQACGPRRDWPGGGSPHRGGISHHNGAECLTWGVPVPRRAWISLRNLLAGGLRRWLGETIGFWHDATTLATWTSNVRGWFTHQTIFAVDGKPRHVAPEQVIEHEVSGYDRPRR